MFGSRGARTHDEDGARPDERLPNRLRVTGTVLEQLVQMDTKGITIDYGSAERLVHDSAARLQILKGNLLDLLDKPPSGEAHPGRQHDRHFTGIPRVIKQFKKHSCSICHVSPQSHGTRF